MDNSDDISTNSGNFRSHAYQQQSDSLTVSSTLTANPAGTWTSIANAAQNSTDDRDGWLEISQGATVSSSANFTTVSGSSLTRTFNESSDGALVSMSGSVWNDWSSIPWYIAEPKEDNSSSSQGAIVTPPAGYSGPGSTTAKISETTTASSTVTGTTTTEGGATSTSSSFSTSTSFDDFASIAMIGPSGFAVSQPNASGSIYTGSAQLNETDLSNGTNTYGLVSGTCIGSA